ncbi:Gfo/Idh/MocA family oxidoreductase [Streptomyces sp. NBS 14/10]|uniref:Gfo/Idh/MocA family protein n=1 Tax=Streptomyces sp. NBS 14/10 TaxID=1945643 RepID=UPI000B7C575B|nr:Gfo/Idh/MocA family oxidoreductase [Streptomyces sp. NBS 14/10]KAK1184367.1 Gfo/Idh/MocA family oxidoreductase [Streptomyces sp. NBS 14/10]
MSLVGIGVIGAGRIAQAAHLPALARADGARLVGVCDPSELLARRVAARYEAPGYTSVDELLADDNVEAVIVAVPDRLHLPLASKALRAGKHVLVEKPLAGTVAEAEELRALVAETGLHLQVGAMKRYDPGVQHAAHAIQNKIGRILSATVWYRVMSGLRPSTEATLFPALVVDQDVRAREATFKANREQYLLTTHGAHVLDGMRYLLGDPTSLSAQMARAGNDLTWHGTASLAEGGLAHFEITANVHAEWSEGADIYGENGYVKLRTHFPFTLRASDVEVFDEANATSERAVFGDSNAYERQIEAFALAIRNNLPDSPSADDGVISVKLINAVAESSAQGGTKVTL